jgi:hypothetical protein
MRPLVESDYVRPLAAPRGHYSESARSISTAIAEAEFGAAVRKYAECEVSYTAAIKEAYPVDWPLYTVDIRTARNDEDVRMVYTLTHNFMRGDTLIDAHTPLMHLIRANTRQRALETVLFKAAARDVSETKFVLAHPIGAT